MKMGEILLPDKLQFLLRPKRIKIAFGGRGGAKTVSFCKALLYKGRKEKLRILCLREFMNSIDDSVHDGLKAEIEILGMSNFYRVTKRQISADNGTRFRYGALNRNLASIKSKHDFNIAWNEEAETTKQKSLDVLIPTIRSAGSELWFSFNPDDEFGPVFQLVKPHLSEIADKGFYEDQDMYIVKINLEDNPFAPRELLRESQLLKETDYKKWLHIYGGEVFSDYKESIIQPEWFDAVVDAHLKLKFKPQGMKVAAFDPADTGKDAKAVGLRYGSVVTHLETWKTGELPEAVDYSFQKAYDWRAEQFVYDATGMGRGVKIGLEKRMEGKSMLIIPYEGGESVDFPDDIYAKHKTNKDTFKNKRAQYYWLLKDRFETTYNAVVKGVYTDPDKMISISSNISCLPLLKNETIKMRRNLRNINLIQMMSKEELLNKHGVPSPNALDVLVMLFANVPPSIKSVPLNFTSEF